MFLREMRWRGSWESMRKIQKGKMDFMIYKCNRGNERVQRRLDEWRL